MLTKCDFSVLFLIAFTVVTTASVLSVIMVILYKFLNYYI